MDGPRARLAEYDASVLHGAKQVKAMVEQLQHFDPPSPDLMASVRAVLTSNLRLLRSYYTVVIVNPNTFGPEEIHESTARRDAIEKALADPDVPLATLQTLGTQILMV